MVEVIRYEDNPQFDRLNIQSSFQNLTISLDSDGDIEIEHRILGRDKNSLFISQEELKAVIEFLQSKVI